MQKDGQPLLGCSVVHQTAPTSSMTMTNMNMEVSPYVDGKGQPIDKPDTTQQRLATLNYLCAADNASLPPAVPFKWNWVDPADVTDHDGILAINRNTFRDYFKKQLDPYVPTCCIKVGAYMTETMFHPEPSWSFDNDQVPTSVTLPPTGQTVLQYDYNSSDSDDSGINGAIGRIQLQSTFNLTVDFVGTAVVIKQHLVV
jgi:hypothetical protein